VPDVPRLIPLFPLPDVVLFPRVSLPLHIFEPRYRKMVADAMESHKTIGMILLRPGWEKDYHGRPPVFGSGCAGRIAACEALPEGKYNIVLRGLSRFRVVEEHAGEPYRLATVEPRPEKEEEEGETADLEDARRRVLAAIGKAADGPSIMVLNADLPHAVFVDALSQSLPLAGLERQSLLDCDTVSGRYARLLDILDFRLIDQTYGRGRTPIVH
jgi:Lon protease-like protein